MTRAEYNIAEQIRAWTANLKRYVERQEEAERKTALKTSDDDASFHYGKAAGLYLANVEIRNLISLIESEYMNEGWEEDRC